MPRLCHRRVTSTEQSSQYMIEIPFPRPLINQILQQAQSAEEREICGLISARAGQPVRSYPVENIASEPTHHFQMAPQQQIDAMRKMREREETLFANYHSHPDAPARPSATDLREAAYSDALYIIISLAIEGTLEIRGFRLHESDVEAVNIVVE